MSQTNKREAQWVSSDHLSGSPLALSSFEISSPVRTLSVHGIVCSKTPLQRARTVIEVTKPKILHLIVDLLGKADPDDPTSRKDNRGRDLQMIGWALPPLELQPIVPLEMLVVELQMTTAEDEDDFHYKACIGPRSVAQRSQPSVIVLYFHIVDTETRSSAEIQGVERLLASVDPYKVAHTIASGEPFRLQPPEPEVVRIFVKRKSNYLDDFHGWCMKRSRDSDGKIVEKEEVDKAGLREMRESLRTLRND
ncbi:hypothetical protein PENSPDRAFT_734705 [Peniophora sp. CONT]|nr:hypothetical protein PENSPDRAFT_734705 [Peniophora sp. CONT]